MKASLAVSKNGFREEATDSPYEHDLHAWLLAQAKALKQRRLGNLDIENLIQEVETLAGRLVRELQSRLTLVLLHLLKWQFRPSKRSPSWESTLVLQRAEVQRLLHENPSLRRRIPTLVEAVYATARKAAGREMKMARWERTLPAECPWTPAQILDEDFLPNSRSRG